MLDHRIVFCAGMSRSGGTLQYQFVKELLERSGYGRGVGFGQERLLLEEHADTIAVKREGYREEYEPLLQSGEAIAVTIHRDPRDVAASLVRFYRERDRFKDLDGQEDYFRFVVDGPLRQALEWFEAWESVAAHVATYERHWPDQWHMEVRNLARVLGIEIRADEAISIARTYSLRKNMDRQRELEHWMDHTDTMLTRKHIGPLGGAPGSWRYLLSEEQVEAVEQLAGDWMTTHGY